MARLPAATELAMVEGGLVPGTTYYLALFTTDPGTTGASGEVTGGSYARQAIVFTATGGGGNTIISTAIINFTGMPVEAGGTPYFGIFSAVTSGTYEGGGTTNLSAAISAGATVQFAAGAVVAAVS
jgi:hypothetical protein